MMCSNKDKVVVQLMWVVAVGYIQYLDMEEVQLDIGLVQQDIGLLQLDMGLILQDSWVVLIDMGQMHQ